MWPSKTSKNNKMNLKKNKKKIVQLFILRFFEYVASI